MVKKALPKKRKVRKASPRRVVLMFGSRGKKQGLGNLPEKAAIKFKEMHEADPNFVVISGCAPGMDTIWEFYAKKYKHKFIPFPAEWRDEEGKYNPGAGFDRNTVMVKKCTEAVAGWDGVSGGTNDTIKKLKKAGKPYEVVMPD